MKTLKEQIEVMQAALDGKLIAIINPAKGYKIRAFSHNEFNFNWQQFDYEIIEEKTVKTCRAH